MLITDLDSEKILSTIQTIPMAEGEVLMLLIATESSSQVQPIIQSLQEQGRPFFGAIFPGIIHGKNEITKGIIIKKWKAAAAPIIIKDVANRQLSGLENLKVPDTEHKLTAFTFVDGLTSHIDNFLESLNNLFGGRVNFIGGGAGVMSFEQQICVFSNEGFFEDAAVICLVDHKVRLGVRHGWEKVAGPLVATQTERNIIHQLNWNNAFEEYKSIIKADSGKEITHENFFEIAKNYPFGIYRENEEDIVRDPFKVGENGELICFGEVKPHTVLNVLKGQPTTLIQAAQEAVNDCKELESTTLHAPETMVVNCISRRHFLENAFEDEMEIIVNEVGIANEALPHGILSLGEISSYGTGLLDIFNKTIVVGTFSH